MLHGSDGDQGGNIPHDNNILVEELQYCALVHWDIHQANNFVVVALVEIIKLVKCHPCLFYRETTKFGGI